MNPDIPPARKRHNRNEFEGKSTSSKPNNSQSNLINKLTQSVNKLTEVIKSFDSSEHSYWDLIKEIPGLDKRSCFKAFKLLNTRAKKIEFLKITAEEHFEWITYELE